MRWRQEPGPTGRPCRARAHLDAALVLPHVVPDEGLNVHVPEEALDVEFAPESQGDGPPAMVEPQQKLRGTRAPDEAHGLAGVPRGPRWARWSVEDAPVESTGGSRPPRSLAPPPPSCSAAYRHQSVVANPVGPPGRGGPRVTARVWWDAAESHEPSPSASWSTRPGRQTCGRGEICSTLRRAAPRGIAARGPRVVGLVPWQKRATACGPFRA